MTLITEQHQELRLQLEQHSIVTSESNKERFTAAGGIQMSEIQCQSNLIGYKDNGVTKTSHLEAIKKNVAVLGIGSMKHQHCKQ